MIRTPLKASARNGSISCGAIEETFARAFQLNRVDRRQQQSENMKSLKRAINRLK